MELSPASIQECAKVIAGDKESPLYRSGPALVELFNRFGARDTYTYGGGFPTRWVYARDKLSAMNGTSGLRDLICTAFHPREFIDLGGNVEPIAYLNKHLAFDGYEIVSSESDVWVREVGGSAVDFKPPTEAEAGLNAQFIDEQIVKCERKISGGDYDGAITNARSMIEAILVDLEAVMDASAASYDGDLPRLYKRVQKLLNLAPGRSDIEQPLKQVLTGLQSVIQGLSSLRNKMGDSHVTSYKAERHHARLVVNSAKTLADFLFATKSYQEARRS